MKALAGFFYKGCFQAYRRKIRGQKGTLNPSHMGQSVQTLKNGWWLLLPADLSPCTHVTLCYSSLLLLTSEKLRPSTMFCCPPPTWASYLSIFQEVQPSLTSSQSRSQTLKHERAERQPAAFSAPGTTQDTTAIPSPSRSLRLPPVCCWFISDSFCSPFLKWTGGQLCSDGTAQRHLHPGLQEYRS